MAESALSLVYSVISAEVAGFLGYSRTSTDWTATESAAIQRCLDTGMRWFLTALDPRTQRSYRWSFLTSQGTLHVWGDVDATMSGVPVFASPISTVTATTSVFYNTMVGKTLTFDTSGTGYVIAGYTSGTVITVTGDASGETSGDDFTITADGSYLLPDDFGSLHGAIRYPVDEGRRPLITTSENRISEMMAESDEDGEPVYVAIRLRSGFVGTSGQRWDAFFYPIPDEHWAMTYSYNVLMPYQVSSTTTYPAGGMPHGEAIKFAALSAAELMLDDRKGLMWDQYQQTLTQSIDYDRRLAPSYVGQNRDESDLRGRFVGEKEVTHTVEGVTPGSTG